MVRMDAERKGHHIILVVEHGNEMIPVSILNESSSSVVIGRHRSSSVVIVSFPFYKNNRVFSVPPAKWLYRNARLTPFRY